MNKIFVIFWTCVFCADMPGFRRPSHILPYDEKVITWPYMWPALPKFTMFAQNVKEWVLLPIAMDSSIKKLIASTPLPKVSKCAFAEACFWGLSDVHCLLLVGFYRQPCCWKSPHDWLILAMDLAMFCDILSAMGPPRGPFSLENSLLSCNSPPPTPI